MNKPLTGILIAGSILAGCSGDKLPDLPLSKEFVRPTAVRNLKFEDENGKTIKFKGWSEIHPINRVFKVDSLRYNLNEERGIYPFHFEIGDSVDYNDIRICNDSLVVTMYDVDKDNEADYVSFWPYPSNRNFTSRDSVRINRLSGEKTYKSLYKAAHEAVQKEMRRRQQNK